MRAFVNILRFFAVLLAVSTAVSCTKEDPNGAADNTEESFAVNVSIDTGAEVTVKSGDTQGNTIKDLKIWAYELNNGTVAPDALPVAFDSTESDVAITSHTFYMRSTAVGKTYRFFAIANKSLFGKIYKAREGYAGNIELKLNAQTTYKELTTGVFDANRDNEGIFKDFPQDDPATPESMPFSHWADIEIPNNGNIEIPVFRPVAKTILNARLKTRSANELLKITSVQIKSARDFHIPNEGFLFSSATSSNLQDTVIVKSPQYWGEYNNLTVTNPTITLKNSDGVTQFSVIDVTSTGENWTPVGSTFLYENNNGENWETASLTSPDAYNYGAYYMQIEYSYGIDANVDNVFDAEQKSATSYVPLPAIVRNRNYTVNATFDISSGIISITADITPWQQDDDDEQGVEFAYPTFEIWPVKTKTVDGNTVYDYDQPIARYKADNGNPTYGENAFQFYFRMQPYGTAQLNNIRTWTISLNNNTNFAIAVEISSNKTTSGTFTKQDGTTFTAAGELYRISIYPKDPLPSPESPAPTTNVVISYYAAWISGNDHLLINSGGGGTLWSNSGHERHQILVTQGANAE